MGIDLDTLTRPTTFGATREIFEPVNGWAGETSPVVVAVVGLASGICQFGYDAPSDTYYARLNVDTTKGWGEWTALVAPPPDPEPPPPEE